MNKIVYLESHSILIDLENILMIEKTEDKETRTRNGKNGQPTWRRTT